MWELRFWRCSAETLRCVLASILAIVLASGAAAQAPQIALEPILSNLTEPVFLTHSRDGTQRRFVVEQSGRILVLQPGATAASVFLDIRERVLAGGERGLLGLAFHPQYAANRRFFVNYTRRPDGATVIAELRTLTGNAQAADPASEIELLVIGQPFSNHNGGMIEFGHDNLLYIGMGDGGSANDPQNRAQNRDELLGKILRIDVDRPAGQSLFSSPPSNPFFGRVRGRDEIYAYGFRNPWRFSFDRLTGDLYAGDVGQSAREEIDVVVLGGNYGWRVFEGTRCTELGPASCAARALFIAPVTEYDNGGTRCSVTAGYVYRGSRQSLPQGAYVFGDYCSGEIFMLHNGVQTVLLDTASTISSFGEDEAGEIYVVGHAGSVHRIVNPAAAPSTQHFFEIPSNGVTVLRSIGATTDRATGYSRIQPSGSGLPAAFALFSLRRGGIVVSEASVPSSPLLQSGRVFAALGTTTVTGIAIANPNSQDVQVEFYFTNTAGQRVRDGVQTLPGGTRITAFLNEGPFQGPDAFTGTFTFRATGGRVSAMALIGRINERSDFLMTPLPVVDLDSPPLPGTFAHWAHGGEWTTEFMLINASTQLSTGIIHMISTSGRVVGTLPYRLEPEAAQILRPRITESATRVGSARITPAVGPSPQGVALFRQTAGGIVVTEAGTPASLPGRVFEGYAEMSVGVRTGLAIANAWPAGVTATISLTRLDGTSAGQASIQFPPLGQHTFFLNELPSLAVAPFEGIVRVTAPTPVVVATLRGRTNERGEILMTVSPPGDVTATASSSEILFPHWVLGDGYDMQFILMNPASWNPSSVSGTIRFLDNSGQPLPLLLP